MVQARRTLALCIFLFFCFESTLAHTNEASHMNSMYALTSSLIQTELGLGETQPTSWIVHLLQPLTDQTTDPVTKTQILLVVGVVIPILVILILFVLFIKMVVTRFKQPTTKKNRKVVRAFFTLTFIACLVIILASWVYYENDKDSRKPRVISRPLSLSSNFTSNSSVLFVTVTTHSERMFESLLLSLQNHSASYQVLGFGEPWQGFIWRQKKLESYLSSLDPNTVVCFLDGFDSLLLANPKELRQKFDKSGARIVFSTETQVGYSEGLGGYIRHKIFGCNPKFCIGMGMGMGYAGELTALLSEVLHVCDDDDDQRCINHNLEVLERHGAAIDYDNDMFGNFPYVQSDIQVVDTTDGKRVQVARGSEQPGAMPCVVSIPSALYPQTIIEPLGYSTNSTSEDSQNAFFNKIPHYAGYVIVEAAAGFGLFASGVALVVI